MVSVTTSVCESLHIRADIIAGHDDLDSTSVTDKYTAFTITDEPSVAGVKIGIPRVRIHTSLYHRGNRKSSNYM